jgi:WD40 repeat protein
MLAVGFSDGIIRFLFLDPKGFTLVKAFKVHKNGIIKIKANRDGTILAVCDSAGSIFFISLDSPVLNKIVPYCLFETGFKINDLCWDRNGYKILLACNDGRLHELNVPK